MLYDRKKTIVTTRNLTNTNKSTLSTMRVRPLNLRAQSISKLVVRWMANKSSFTSMSDTRFAISRLSSFLHTQHISSSLTHMPITLISWPTYTLTVLCSGRCSSLYQTPSGICRKHASAHCSLRHFLNRSRQMPAALSISQTATHITALPKTVKWRLYPWLNINLQWLNQNVLFSKAKYPNTTTTTTTTTV